MAKAPTTKRRPPAKAKTTGSTTAVKRAEAALAKLKAKEQKATAIKTATKQVADAKAALAKARRS